MADVSGAANFDIARVVSRAMDAIGKNVGMFIGLAVILSGIPTFAVSLWQVDATTGLGVDATRFMTPAFWMPALVAWLVSVIANAVLQASLTRATVQHLSDETPDFTKTLGVGLAMILPMIAIGILLLLGLAVGFLLLIVPGIILWLIWSVVVPVYVQERRGIFESFSRSGELTSGARLKIFLLFLAVVVAIWVLSIPIGLLSAALGMGQPIIMSLITSLFGAVTAMVMVTLQASTYVELREVKEGVAPSELEAIFA